MVSNPRSFANYIGRLFAKRDRALGMVSRALVCDISSLDPSAAAPQARRACSPPRLAVRGAGR